MSKKPFGAVLIHGITGTPENVKAIAPPIEALGIPVLLPTLRGHGAESPEALECVEYMDWLEDAEKALLEILEQAEKAIIIGHSMGGWIALNLASEHPDKIDSIVVAAGTTLITSPFGPYRPLHFLYPIMLKLFKKWDMPPNFADPKLTYRDPTYPWAPTDVFKPLFDFLRLTHSRLPGVNVPVLILHSRNDTTNSPDGVEPMYNRLSTPEDQKRIVWFEKTEHEMFLDCETEVVVQTIVDFVRERMESKMAAKE
jgi:carboxylesterase